MTSRTQCIKTDKPLVVYLIRNAMHSMYGKAFNFAGQKSQFQKNLVIRQMEPNSQAPVLLNVLTLLRKSNKIIVKPRILSLFLSLYMITHV